MSNERKALEQIQLEISTLKKLLSCSHVDLRPSELGQVRPSSWCLKRKTDQETGSWR